MYTMCQRVIRGRGGGGGGECSGNWSGLKPDRNFYGEGEKKVSLYNSDCIFMVTQR